MKTQQEEAETKESGPDEVDFETGERLAWPDSTLSPSHGDFVSTSLTLWIPKCALFQLLLKHAELDPTAASKTS